MLNLNLLSDYQNGLFAGEPAYLQTASTRLLNSDMIGLWLYGKSTILSKHVEGLPSASFFMVEIFNSHNDANYYNDKVLEFEENSVITAVNSVKLELVLRNCFISKTMNSFPAIKGNIKLRVTYKDGTCEEIYKIKRIEIVTNHSSFSYFTPIDCVITCDMTMDSSIISEILNPDFGENQFKEQAVSDDDIQDLDSSTSNNQEKTSLFAKTMSRLSLSFRSKG